MSTMTSSIEMYERLVAAEDDRARARIIAEGFERLEDRYPELRDLATASGVRESELALRGDIERTRLRIEEVRADLSKEIEEVRAELSKEIEQLRVETETVRADLGRDIERVRADLGRDIERMRTELGERIHGGQVTTIRWTIGLLLTQTAVLVAVFSDLFRVSG